MLFPSNRLNTCLGELAPEPDEHDDSAYVSMQDPCPAAYEQQAALPYREGRRVHPLNFLHRQ